MSISLELIKDLRERTGAGMADCKNALTEVQGDVEKAIELLRKKGIAKAAKRSDRETTEGLVKLATNETGKEGYIVEINAETDFVVRSDGFQSFASRLIDFIKETQPKNLEQLMASKFENGTVQEDLEAFSSVVGEKLEIKKFAHVSTTGSVGVYSHAGGRIGALVAIDKADAADLARDIAMQVAASYPKYIKPEDVPAAEVEKEKDIYAEQLRKEGKPEEMIAKIMAGKVNKYYEEVCLIKQEYIKDDSKKIENILAGANVENMIRFSL
ncbi:MAG: translation elongation factor Ts [bacterium]